MTVATVFVSSTTSQTTLFPKLTRFGSSLLLASGMTLCLLWIMTQMVGRTEIEISAPESFNIPNFVTEITESDPEIIKPSKPDMPEAQPDSPKMVIPDSFTPNNALPMVVAGPTIEKINIDTIGGPGGQKLIPVTAEYPVAALEHGRCGEVLIEFDVSPAGVPANIRIVESSHRVFNKSAIRAIERYRFSPMKDGNQAVWVTGKQEVVTYRIEEGCDRH